MLKIAVLLTAVDKMSSVIKNAVGQSESDLKRLSEKQKALFGKGAGMAATGGAVLASLTPAIQAFGDLEEAQLRLKASMMGPGGVVSELFPKVDKLAEELGDKLPGTTADFYNMFEVMQNSGIKTESILNGVGKAASYLAVNIKMPYDEAGKFAAKMKEATGIADADMLKFMDTIARVKNLGVEAGEMQYAFGRSAGALKLLGIQGLEASKSVSAVYAQLIRSGMSGETVGTGFATIFGALLDPKKMAAFNEETAKLGMQMQFFKDGKFLGIENMIGQLDRLKNLDPGKRASVINALTGGGQDAQMLQTLISNGVEGFNKMNKAMAAQATLEQKVTSQLGGLKAMWEATTGTITNMLAAMGKGLEPALKPLVDMIGRLAGWFKEVLQNNPALAKFLGMLVAGTGVLLTVVGIVNMVRSAFIMLRIAVMAAGGPWIWIATIAIMAISLIYANWDKIKAWFAALWERVKAIFGPAIAWLWKIIYNFTPIGWFMRLWKPLSGLFSAMWDLVKAVFSAAFGILKAWFLNFTPLGLIFKHWDKVAPYFQRMWDLVKLIFQKMWDWVSDFAKQFYDVGAKIIQMIIDGITSKVNQLTDKVKGVAKEIRDFFPFSPAKTGPLRDIHKIKLVETIADAVKPAALMPKMRAVAGVIAGQQPMQGGGGGLSFAGARGGGVTVQMNITVNGGATAAAANSFIAELRKNKAEITRIIEEAVAAKQRRSFS